MEVWAVWKRYAARVIPGKWIQECQYASEEECRLRMVQLVSEGWEVKITHETVE